MKATRNGALVAVLGVTIMSLCALISWGLDSTEGVLGYYNDYGSLVFGDIIIYSLLAYGVSKHSRAASILLLAVYIIAICYVLLVERESLLTTVGHWLGASVAILFFSYFYTRAVQGAFAYHRIEKKTNPEKYIRKKWHYFLGIPLALIGIIFLIFLGAGVMMEAGKIPDAEVVTGEQLSQEYKSVLLSNIILHKDENLLYFYSTGLFSILENDSTGSLLTDKAVVMYTVDENGKLEIYEIPLGEISSMERLQEGSIILDTEYKIHSLSGDWLIVTLSTFMSGDTKFIEKLRKMSPQL